MKLSLLGHIYGWRPQLPDFRDFVRMPAKLTAPDPFSDLRSAMPLVYDQTTLGSCTANATDGNVHYDLMRQGLPAFAPSRLFTYYNTRDAEGTVAYDAGGTIRDAIKTVNTFGVCPETDWPYDVDKFAEKPTPACYTNALLYKSLKYEGVNLNLNSIRECLTAKLPIAFGFTVYESFESDQVAETGIMPMPGASETAQGGHAVLAVGHNDSLTETVDEIPPQCIAVRNSWGVGWGKKGYFFMPYDYITDPNLAQDGWSIQVVQ